MSKGKEKKIFENTVSASFVVGILLGLILQDDRGYDVERKADFVLGTVP